MDAGFGVPLRPPFRGQQNWPQPSTPVDAYDPCCGFHWIVQRHAAARLTLEQSAAESLIKSAGRVRLGALDGWPFNFARTAGRRRCSPLPEHTSVQCGHSAPTVGEERTPPVFPPQTDPLQWVDEQANRAVHVSFWICSPGYESVSLDVAVRFPTDMQHMHEVIQDSLLDLPTETLNHTVATYPQISEDFGSMLVIPSWILQSPKVAMVIDARAVNRGLSAVYLEGTVTRREILRRVDIHPDDLVSVYPMGALQPLGILDALELRQGGLLKILPYGEVVDWASDLEPRWARPQQWRPATEHPQHRAGRHIYFQTAQHDYFHQVNRLLDTNPTRVACAAFGLEEASFWLRAPTERPQGLYSIGRRVHSMVAVLDRNQHPPDRTKVVFLDLRGLGLWPQWAAVEQGVFHPGRYLEGLQIPYIPHFSLVVYGGRRHEDQGYLYINDGEVLRLVLKRTRDITPTPTASSGDDFSGDGPGDDSDENDDLDHPLPDSSDFSDGPSPQGPGPYGPPVPRPVNEDRSRSPRQDDTTATDGSSSGDWVAADTRLSALVEPPVFDIAQHSVPLPHDFGQLCEFFHPWPPNWCLVDFGTFKLKEATTQHIDKMTGWPDLLSAIPTGGEYTIHCYTDGSWLAKEQAGGYSVVVVVEHGKDSAYLGAVGEKAHGNETSLWPCEKPPALYNEIAALIASCLWIAQSLTYLHPSSYRIHFDCMVAGLSADGSWEPPNPLAKQAREIYRWLCNLLPVPLHAVHVKAHAGDPHNECADVLAQAAAREHPLPAPPMSVIRLATKATLTWSSTQPTPLGDSIYWSRPLVSLIFGVAARHRLHFWKHAWPGLVAKRATAIYRQLRANHEINHFPRNVTHTGIP